MTNNNTNNTNTQKVTEVQIAVAETQTEPEKTENVTIAEIKLYNQRRYNKPWAARLQDGKYNFNGVGDYTGNHNNGEAGEILIHKPITGAVYAIGQKDYRNSKQTVIYYAVYDGKQFIAVDKTGKYATEKPEPKENFTALNIVAKTTDPQPTENNGENENNAAETNAAAETETAAIDAPAKAHKAHEPKKAEKPATKADRKEARASKIAKLAKMIDEGQKKATADPEAYIKFMAGLKSKQYSERNMYLIFKQNDKSTELKGFKQWNKEGRKVKKGEHGITIYAPRFATGKAVKPVDIIENGVDPEAENEEKVMAGVIPVTVFDISQTEPAAKGAKAQTTAEIEEIHEPKATADEAALWTAINKISPLPIEIGKPKTIGARGECYDKFIVVGKWLDMQNRIKTAIHEVAHAKLHRFGQPGDYKARAQKEIEAESIAYIVAGYYGIDTSSYSYRYVNSWAKRPEAVQKSLNTIQATAAEIIEAIDAELTAKAA